MVVWALGASIGFSAVNIAAVAGTKHGEEGLASGMVNTSFRIGFPVGLVVLLTIANVFDPPPTGPTTASAVAAGVVAGFQVALFAGALLGVLGLLIALKLRTSNLSGASQAGTRKVPFLNRPFLLRKAD